MFSLLVILYLKIFFHKAGGSTGRRRVGTWDQTKNMCPLLVFTFLVRGQALCVESLCTLSEEN